MPYNKQTFLDGDVIPSEWANKLEKKLKEAYDILENCSIVKSNKDSNGIYQNVEYRRPDGTLYIGSVLYNGTSPQYTNRAEYIYDVDGTTLLMEQAFLITYDTDGDVVSEVRL